MTICDRALELANGDPSVGQGIGPGCPYAFCLGFKGLFLISLGELGRAHSLLEQGREIAREQGDVEAINWSHVHATQLAYACGDPATARRHAREAVDGAERIGDSFSRAWAWFGLGLAEHMGGHWHRAIEALEHSSAIAREGRTAAERDAWCDALLGESHLRAGDPRLARDLVERGLAVAREHRQIFNETFASLALARVLLGSAGLAAAPEIEAALDRAFELVRQTGAKAIEPHVHVELAALARLRGDRGGEQRELRRAHQLFAKIGATGHARRLAVELAVAAW